MPTTYAIPNGRTVMDVSLWTGTGAAQTITNQYGFKPDLVWPKIRSGADGHFPIDTVRGIDKFLITNSTAAEATDAQEVTSINSNGFTLGTSTNGNRSGYTFVGWQWQAGQGTTSSNTSGTITSTTSKNTTAGFSIVTYTGNGTNGATVGHGLGATPGFIIVKRRDTTSYWQTAHSSYTSGYNVILNLTDPQAAVTAFTSGGVGSFNSTTFTCTQGVSNSDNVNANGGTYVAYCWTPIAGYSAFGSYTGNGSTDGTFVYTGFRPKFVMRRRIDTGAYWVIYDTARNPYNAANLDLYPNDSAAEATGNDMDILSNGFKLRSAGANMNANGGTYVYICFAENPFKYANAR